MIPHSVIYPVRSTKQCSPGAVLPIGDLAVFPLRMFLMLKKNKTLPFRGKVEERILNRY
jgi:hypothetical protein